MADYRISEKLVKSLFFIIPGAIVTILSVGLVLYLCRDLINIGPLEPSAFFVDSTSISSVKKTLESDQILTYFLDGEHEVPNNEESKKYLYETLSTKQNTHTYEKRDDSSLDYSYKLKIAQNAQQDYFYSFYLFNEENKIGIRITQESDNNDNEYIRFFDYAQWETHYLVHNVMKI